MTNQEEKITSGDKVKLKSGDGPVMVVGEKFISEMVACYWFDSHHVFHKEPFHISTLIKRQ